MYKAFILLSVIAVTLTSSLKVQCKHDSECGTDECCYYHEGPMIMSKRQTFPGMVQGGWCEKYKLQGEHCSNIDKMNGHCECAPGLKCNWIPHPLLSIIMQPEVHHARSIPFGGHYEC